MHALFFSPYADVWVHGLPEALIAEVLSDHDWEVSRITCDGELSGHCVAMAAKGVGYHATKKERLEVCDTCKSRQKLLKRVANSNDISLSTFIKDADRMEVANLLKSVTPETWHLLQVDGINVGKIAAYDFLLTYKINSLEIPAQYWSAYLTDLENSLKVFFAATSFLTKLNPDIVVTYNGMYATNNLVNQLARQMGIRTWSLHAGHHLVDKFSTLYIYESSQLPVMAYKTDRWKSQRHVPIGPEDSQHVTEHLLQLFKGINRFVYSAPSGQRSSLDIKKILGVQPGSKVLLATMSSSDEVFAAQMAGVLEETETESLFLDGVVWINYLVSELENRPDLHLVIRVHPREFPNKRELVSSKQAAILLELFQSLPNNVSVNWPDQELSLYDVAQITDVVLNATSTAGIELGALGLPVVHHRVAHMLAYDPLMYPVVNSREDYFLFVDRALETGWSIENMRLAYRWWAFFFRHVAIDIGEGFSYPADGYISASNGKSANLRNSVLQIAVKYGPSVMEYRDMFRRRPMKNADLIASGLAGVNSMVIAPQSELIYSVEQETSFLAAEMRRIDKHINPAGFDRSNWAGHMSSFISEAQK